MGFLKSVAPQKKVRSRTRLTRAFDRLRNKALDTVKDALQCAKAENAWLSLGADSWKAKGKKRKQKTGRIEQKPVESGRKQNGTWLNAEPRKLEYIVN